MLVGVGQEDRDDRMYIFRDEVYMFATEGDEALAIKGNYPGQYTKNPLLIRRMGFDSLSIPQKVHIAVNVTKQATKMHRSRCATYCNQFNEFFEKHPLWRDRGFADQSKEDLALLFKIPAGPDSSGFYYTKNKLCVGPVLRVCYDTLYPYLYMYVRDQSKKDKDSLSLYVYYGFTPVETIVEFTEPFPLQCPGSDSAIINSYGQTNMLIYDLYIYFPARCLTIGELKLKDISGGYPEFMDYYRAYERKNSSKKIKF